jgi:proline iminopeptidase
VRVPINGIELEVESFGDPAAPAIIAHHGAPGLSSRKEPRAALGPLADRFRVVVFDARGSGESDWTPPYSHEQWAADIEAVRVWAGAERFVMAGGSYGGFLALEYTLRHPERVEALVLRDTAADASFLTSARAHAAGSDRVRVDMEAYDRMFAGQLESEDDFRAAYAAIAPLYSYDPDSPTSVDLDHARLNHRAHNAAFATNLPAYDLTGRLGEIGCPALVTTGRHDWIVPVAAAEQLAWGIPNARLAVFERSGHSPQIEEHEAWVAAVREFLER